MDDGREPRRGPAAAASLAAVGVMALALLWMGRQPWCAQGDWSPVSWDIWSPHNSQHLFDPYAFTHMLHGVFFFWALVWIGARWTDVRVVVAVVLESLWELVENSEAVIEHYRETTISLDYVGDSVANSISDVGAMGLGYLIASRLPWWASALGFVGTELVLAWWIRDSQTLNVLMLIWPIEAIKTWQLGG